MGMDINDFLTSGSNIQGGKGLHEQKKSRSNQSKEIATEVVLWAVLHGLESASEEFLLSTTAVSKYLARAIKKKDSELCAETFLDSDKISNLESFIRGGNTTSIKRLVSAGSSRFTEAEIRIVKADIESKGIENWEY